MFDDWSWSFAISIIALLVSAGNFFYNRYRTIKLIEYQDRDFEYKEKKDKEDFILTFKDDLHSLRLDLIELNSTKTTINFKDKDQYLYLIEDKYNKETLLKYLEKSKYDSFLNLKINIDDALNKIIYKSDYSLILGSSRKMKFFFQSI